MMQNPRRPRTRPDPHNDPANEQYSGPTVHGSDDPHAEFIPPWGAHQAEIKINPPSNTLPSAPATPEPGQPPRPEQLPGVIRTSGSKNIPDIPHAQPAGGTPAPESAPDVPDAPFREIEEQPPSKEPDMTISRPRPGFNPFTKRKFAKLRNFTKSEQGRLANSIASQTYLRRMHPNKHPIAES